MKLSLIGRLALALFATLTLGLGMTGCGGGTIGFMWVLGQQFNQIAGFKIDDFTGNLTQIPHQPFPSGGVNPVMLVVKGGGRYLYVLNQGAGDALYVGQNAQFPNGRHATDGNISVFAVGGDGTLTFQQSYITQGFNSQWLQIDASGGYLYVLDQYAPNYNGTTNTNGSISAYAMDATSGRLTLVTNQQACVAGVCPNYFEVGSTGSSALPGPFQMKTAGSCLFVANRTAVVPFSFGSGGQLVNTTTNTIINVQGAAHISSITGNSSFVNITDDQNDTLSRYQVGGACGLALAGAGVRDLAADGIVNPAWTLIDSTGNSLFVLGQTNPNTTPGQQFSTISAYTVTQSNNQIAFTNTYGVGSHPVCSVEDPTNQYIYTSNHNDGTISGNVIDTTHRTLAPLTRGSTFQATGEAECLAVSGSID
jgi:6-phosphogluconolactonase (cycloisomerase 2 family)